MKSAVHKLVRWGCVWALLLSVLHVGCFTTAPTKRCNPNDVLFDPTCACSKKADCPTGQSCAGQVCQAVGGLEPVDAGELPGVPEPLREGEPVPKVEPQQEPTKPEEPLAGDAGGGEKPDVVEPTVPDVFSDGELGDAVNSDQASVRDAPPAQPVDLNKFVVGTVWNPAMMREEVYQIDPKTGVHTIIGDMCGLHSMSTSGALIDAVGQALYIYGAPQGQGLSLYRFDLRTKKCSNIPFLDKEYPSTLVGVDQGMLYGIRRDFVTNVEYVAVLNPKTGAAKNLGALCDLATVDSYGVTFDRNTRTLYVLGSGKTSRNLYSFSLQTNKCSAVPMMQSYILIGFEPSPGGGIVAMTSTQGAAQTLFILDANTGKARAIGRVCALFKRNALPHYVPTLGEVRALGNSEQDISRQLFHYASSTKSCAVSTFAAQLKMHRVAF